MVYFGLHALSWTHGLAPMWSGLYIISTWNNIVALITLNECQCPLGLIPHFYIYRIDFTSNMIVIVSMPSRAYTSFLRYFISGTLAGNFRCVNALSGLYLISTRTYEGDLYDRITIVSMPSRAYTSFLR